MHSGSSVTFCRRNYRNLRPSLPKPALDKPADLLHTHTANTENKIKLRQYAAGIGLC